MTSTNKWAMIDGHNVRILKDPDKEIVKEDDSIRHVFVIGSKGIPAAYGGFETFVEKLTQYRVSDRIHYHVARMAEDVLAALRRFRLSSGLESVTMAVFASATGSSGVSCVPSIEGRMVRVIV